MGVFNSLNRSAARLLTATSQANIGNATTLSYKLRLRGDNFTEYGGADSGTLLEIGALDGTNANRKMLVSTHWTISDTFEVYGRHYGNAGAFLAEPLTNCGATSGGPVTSSAYYILYGVWDPAADSGNGQSLQILYDASGNVVGSAFYAQGGATLNNGAGMGRVRLLQGAPGAVDGLAIYSVALNGAARWSAPALDDIGLLAYWPLDTTTGSVSSNAVSGGEAFGTAGVENTDFQWLGGGSWTVGSVVDPDIIIYEFRAS